MDKHGSTQRKAATRRPGSCAPDEEARDYVRRELDEQVRPGRRIFRIPLTGFAGRR